MSRWINADVQFTRHLAELRLSAWQTERLKKFPNIASLFEQSPEGMESFVKLLLSVWKGGCYATADIWRLCIQPYYDGITITACHPAFPVVEEGCIPEAMEITFADDERERVVQMLMGNTTGDAV